MHTVYNLPRKHHLDRNAAALAETIAAGGDPDDCFTDTRLAGMLDVTIQWCQIGRLKGYGPKFIRLSPRIVRTRRDDLVAWLRERTHQRTSEYADPAKPKGRPPGTRVIAGHEVRGSGN